MATGWRASVASWIDDCRLDVRYAAGSLKSTPGFAAAAILTLAIGVGASTAVFSVVNALIFRPLPALFPERLTVVATTRLSSDTLSPVSFRDLEDYRAATRDTFDDIAGYTVGFVGMARDNGAPERILVSWVTGNYFRLLGLRPVLGRTIAPDEGLPGRVDAIAVLGYQAWQRRFEADPNVVGRQVRVNGRPCSIVGVGPPGFSGAFAFSESELYLPLNWASAAPFDDRGARTLHSLARLKSGVTLPDAQAALEVVARQLEREYPDTNAGIRLRVMPERLARPEEDNARSNAFGGATILALVGLVFLIAQSNVAGLLVARGASRRREFAVRAALGACRGRLLRQFFTESALLATVGGVAGIGLGACMSGLLTRVRLPGDLPVKLDFGLDTRVLAVGVATCAVGTLLVGSTAAWHAARANANEALLGFASGTGPSATGRRVRESLVMVQIAVAFVLAVTGALFARSLAHARDIDLGFRPEGVVNVQMDVAQVGYSESQGRAFFDAAERRVRAIPGVDDASFAFSVPMGYVRSSRRLHVEGRLDAAGDLISSGKNVVGPQYFSTLGITLESGRGFNDADAEGGRPVAVVNRRPADLLWPGSDPIGRRFSEAGPNGPWIEVVGTTATGTYRHVFETPQPHYYVPMAQQYTALRVLHVRTRLPEDGVALAIERALRDLEPSLPLFDRQPMTRALDGGYGFFLLKTGAIFAAVLGIVALLLAVVGLYGLVACRAAERVREFGIQIAVGAGRSDIALSVLREAARITIGGTLLGTLAAFVASQLLSRLLFGVGPADPLSFLLAFGVSLLVTLLATWGPARRASRTDPATALGSQ